MPATFLLFLVFMLCAVVSPLAILGVAWTMFSPQWRRLGFQGAKFGVISAMFFCAASELLSIVLADGAERSAFSISVVCGAGFTIGIIVMYLWEKVRQVFTAEAASRLWFCRVFAVPTLNSQEDYSDFKSTPASFRIHDSIPSCHFRNKSSGLRR